MRNSWEEMIPNKKFTTRYWTISSAIDYLWPLVDNLQKMLKWYFFETNVRGFLKFKIFYLFVCLCFGIISLSTCLCSCEVRYQVPRVLITLFFILGLGQTFLYIWSNSLPKVQWRNVKIMASFKLFYLFTPTKILVATEFSPT